MLLISIKNKHTQYTWLKIIKCLSSFMDGGSLHYYTIKKRRLQLWQKKRYS